MAGDFIPDNDPTQTAGVSPPASGSPDFISDADMAKQSAAPAALPDFISDEDMAKHTATPSSPDFISDADMAKPPLKAEDPTMTTVREAASDIIPTVGAIPAMTAGARVGGVAGLALTGGNPLGGLAGAGIGMVGAGMLAGGVLSKAQDIVKRVLGIDDSAQRAINAQENPNAAMLGAVPGIVAGFRSGPWKGAKAIASHLTTGAAMGGITAATEAVTGEDFNAKDIAMSALTGGIFNEFRGGLPTKLAKVGETVGDRILKAVSHGSPGPLAAGGVAQTATPVKQEIPGLGNTDTQPGVRDGGNDGKYAKTAETSEGSTVVENVDNGVSSEFQSVLSKEKGEEAPAAPLAAANDNAPVPPPANDNAPAPAPVPPAPVPPATEFNKNGKPTPPEADLSRTSTEDLVDQSKAQREAAKNVKEKVTAPQAGEAFQPETEAQAAVPEREAKPTTADEAEIPGVAKPTSYEAPAPGDVYSHVDPSLRGVLIRREQTAPNMVGSNRAGTEMLMDKRVPRVIDAVAKDGGTKPLDPAQPLAVREYTRRQVLDMLSKEPAEEGKPKMPFAQQLEASKQAGEHAERMWLDQRGYNPEEFQKQVEGFKTLPLKPVTVTVKHPPFVEKTLARLREAGKEDQAKALETKLASLKTRKDKNAAASLAAKYIISREPENLTVQQLSKPLKTPRLDQSGHEIDNLGVTDHLKAEADRKTKSIEAAEAAFNSNKPPEKAETKSELRARLTKAIGEAKTANEGRDAVKEYRPQDPPEYWHWLNEAQQLIKGRMLDRQVAKFLANEKLLRGGEEDVNAYKADRRGEGETASNPRSGEAAVAAAEAEQAKKFPGETPHEEAEPDTRPEPVTAADMTEPDKTKNLDVSELSDEEKAAISRDMRNTTEAMLNKPDELTGQGKGKLWKAQEQERLSAQETNLAKQKRAREARDLAQKTAGKEPEAKPGAVRKVEVTPEMKAKYEGEPKEVASQAQKEADLSALEAGLKENPTSNTLKDLFTDEKASLNPKAVLTTLNAPKSKTYSARGSRSVEEDYANSMSQKFANLRGQDTHSLVDARKAAKAMPKEVQAIDGKLYKAQETDTISSLPKAEQTLFNKYIKPHLDRADKLFDNIEKLAPGLLGPKVDNHIWRMRVGGEGDELAPDKLKTGVSGDPIQGTSNPLYSGKVGPMYERKFYALERSDGKRFVISPSEKGGFLSWDKGTPHMVSDPTFKFKDGDTYTNGKKTYTMDQAFTDEIEAQTGVKYHKSAILSAILAEQRLSLIARHLQYIAEQKDAPEFKTGKRQLATQNPKLAAENGWITTDLKAFKGWYMHPRLAEVMDDFQRPGFGTADSAWDKVRQFSQAVTKLLFWLPTAHIENVGTHWFTARGLEWLRPRGYKSLMIDGADAMRSVMSQDKFYTEALDKGAGLIYGSTVTQDIVGQVAHAAGLTIKSDPATWGPIAKTLGVGVDDMIKGVYNASKHAMWYTNDVFLIQLLKENMRNGMNMDQAIVHAEKYFPNYRVASRMLGSRVLSKIMQSPELSAFGRYHSGVWTAYSNVVKDLLSPNSTGKDRAEAVGHLMMMGVLAYGIYPVLDKAARWLTDNPDASMYRRGPLAIPNAIARAVQGKGDIMQSARDTFTLPPLATTIGETLRNKNYANKNVIEPGDFTSAAHGSGKAALRVGTQLATHTAQGLVSPLSTVINAERNQGVPAAMRDQLLGIKDPSLRARIYERTAAYKNEKAAEARFSHPQTGNPIENWLNRLIGYK